jgi:hypothetical protein
MATLAMGFQSKREIKTGTELNGYKVIYLSNQPVS